METTSATTAYAKENLEAAQMAQFIRFPQTEAAKAFVSELTTLTLAQESAVNPRARVRRSTDHKNFVGAVAAFAADLIVHSAKTDAHGFMYRARDKVELSKTLVSDRCFTQLTKAWQDMGILEKTGFFRVKETFEGENIGVYYARASRFRCKFPLLDLASRHGILPTNVKDHFNRDFGRISIVTVRDEKIKSNGKRLQSKNLKASGHRYEAEVLPVQELNGFLRSGGFDLSDTPWVYRLYNRGNYPDFDYNMGGRMYCGSEDNWQGKSSVERSRITKNGRPTVEIDVRASHLHILYAIHDLDLPVEPDPYALSTASRDVVKGLFAAICGRGGRPTQWPQGMADDYKEQTGNKISSKYKLSQVLDGLYALHPVLHRVTAGKLDWARLQYEESACFMSAMLELGRNHEVAALPVHDSLIVDVEDRELAEDILGLAYERRVGHRPIIRVK